MPDKNAKNVSLIKMFSKLWQYQIIWYLFAGYLFKDHNLVFLPYDSWNMCFLLKYDLWKLQLESWNMNHESLDWTLKEKVVQTPRLGITIEIYNHLSGMTGNDIF